MMKEPARDMSNDDLLQIMENQDSEFIGVSHHHLDEEEMNNSKFRSKYGVIGDNLTRNNNGRLL